MSLDTEHMELSEIKSLTEPLEQLRVIDELIEHDPEVIDVLIYKGKILRKLHQYEEVHQWFLHVIRMYPSHRLVQLEFASAKISIEQYRPAETILQTLLKRNEKDTQAYLRLGILEVKKGNYKKAVEYYQTIQDIEPLNKYVTYHLSEAFDKLNDYTKAKETLVSRLILSENEMEKIPTLLQLAKLCSNNNEDKSALLYSKEVLRIAPNDPKSLERLMTHYLSIKDYVHAIQVLQTIDFASEKSLKLMEKSVEISLRCGNAGKARQILERMEALYPDDPAFIFSKVEYYFHKGQYERIEPMLGQLDTSVHPACIPILIEWKARIAFLQYNYEESSKQYEQIVKFGKENKRAWKYYAAQLMMNGDIEKAKELLQTETNIIIESKVSRDRKPPLKSHVAKLLDQLSFMPNFTSGLKKSSTELPEQRLHYLIESLLEEPYLFGPALALVKELRIQGHYEMWMNNLDFSSASKKSIPKTLNFLINEKRLSFIAKKSILSWTKLNPAFKLQKFNADAAKVFLEDHYDASFVDKFVACGQDDLQSDLFKMAYLYKKGGYFIDAQIIAQSTIDHLSECGASLILHQEEYFNVGNNFMACMPGDKMMGEALQYAMENILDYSGEGTWFRTGPGNLTSFFALNTLDYLKQKSGSEYPSFLILDKLSFHQIAHQVQV